MILDILSGIRAYFSALELFSKMKLWKFFVIPMLLSSLLTVIIGSLVYLLSDNIGMYLGSFWPWDWGKETFETLSAIFGGLFIITIGFLIFKHLVLAFSSPFMGPVSELIEIHLTGVKSLNQPSSSAQLLVRSLRIAIRNFLWELLFTIPILLIGIIPIIGIFSTILLFLLQSYFAGFGNMDYTLERHFNYQDSIKFVKRNKSLAIGNGIVFMLFLLIPIVGIIFVLPFSVTAATSETIKKIQQE